MPALTNIRMLHPVSATPIPDAAMAWGTDHITFVGPRSELPHKYHNEAINAHGAVVIPGLVDSHTHLAFGGWRTDEFVERCRGATYLEIASRGGGILSTVRKTRAATEDELLQLARARIQEMLVLGVTTVEAKSGYGLTVPDELKMLRVYRRLRTEFPGRIARTFLGAHVVPPEFTHNRAGYVRLICQEMLPLVAEEGLAEFCDVFVEEGAFSIEEGREILIRGAELGLKPKLHADQLHAGGGAHLAAEVGAVSADHLEFATESGLEAMARSGTVAVLLPIPSLVLRQPPLDARKCHSAGVEVAIATDFNPGSGPSGSMPLAMALACVMHHMSPAEVLRASTLTAAKAIGLESEVGSLEIGKRADFVLLATDSFDHWLYRMAPPSVQAVYVAGECVAGKSSC